MAQQSAYLWDPAYLGHFTSTIHPESPKRAEALAADKMREEFPKLKFIPIDQHLGRPWVMRVHDRAYVDRVARAHERGERSLDNGDTVVRMDTFTTALSAAAGAISLVRAVCQGDVRNGFAAIRPPGHHAGRANARGFCYFNNVAIAATYPRQQLGLERILIVDFDVHPADGTSAIFYEDPDVHVYSIHQHGIFSSTVGLVEHRGDGAGRGATHNVPISAGTGDAGFEAAFRPTFAKAFEAAAPDLILISAGFDAHAGDPIGGLRLTDPMYRVLIQIIREAAEAKCGGRIGSILEGGYSPPIVGRCVREHLRVLSE